MSLTEPAGLGGRTPLRVVDDGERTPIVLLGAEADAATLHQAHAVLDRAAVEVLLGVDRDVEPLREAIALAEQPTLFVLCRTETLDADRARAAVACFAGRRAATHRLLVVELEPRRGTRWLGTVRMAAAALARTVRHAGPTGVDGMRDSGTFGQLGGETRPAFDVRDEPALALRPVHVAGHDHAEHDPRPWWRDEVGPIPPHVRIPGRPRRGAETVDSQRDTADDLPEAISDAALTYERAANEAPWTAAASGPRPREATALPSGRAIAIAIVALMALAYAIAPVLH